MGLIPAAGPAHLRISQCTLTCQHRLGALDCAHNSICTAIPTLHTDVVGSLLRPAYLLRPRPVERGELTAAEFKSIEDRAVDEAVALQEAAGLDVITDGEMRRYAFFGHLVEALEGFDKLRLVDHLPRRRGHEAPLQRPVVVDKLRWRRQMASRSSPICAAGRRGR